MCAAEEGKLQVVFWEDSFNHECEPCALARLCNRAEGTFYSTPSATSPADIREKLAGTEERGNQNTKVLSVKSKENFRGFGILFCVGS